MLMEVYVAAIHSIARGRSFGCWYRWRNKPWKSKGAPPNWRNEEGGGGPPVRPAAGICRYKCTAYMLPPAKASWGYCMSHAQLWPSRIMFAERAIH